MAAPSVILSGVGQRSSVVFNLNTAGYIDATSHTTVYEGLYATGVKTTDYNDPMPRFITHLGDDSPFALDILPPAEAATGQISFGKRNDTLDAALTGITSFTVGEAKGFAFDTNKRGFERTVAMVVYRQAVVTDPTSATYGNRVWDSKFFPFVTLFPIEPGFNDNPETRLYAFRPGFSTKQIWGTALATGTEGVIRAQGVRYVTQYEPKVVGWRANGSATTFTFSTNYQAVSTAKIHGVWVDGVVQTVGITLATTGVTFSVAPTNLANINVFYEFTSTP